MLTTQGTIADPYDNLMDAIRRAFEVAAPYLTAQINIFMFPGTHYLLRNTDLKYVPTKVDENSQQMDLVIKPFYSNETGATAANSIAYSAVAQPVFIVNKIRGYFQIPISKSLLFQDIIVDSIDSSFSCK